ncbi:unnamed protein product, partial [Nesidiocoris tenuis]
MDGDDDYSVYRLEGVQETGGGLIIKKKPSPQGSFTFKVPEPSLLGLDRLAAQRRKEKLEAESAEVKKPKVEDAADEAKNLNDENIFKKPAQAKARQYRDKAEETPTHTGGVSREAKERMDFHRHKEKPRGLRMTDSDKKKDKDRSRDKNRISSRDERDRRRRDHRNDRSERRDRSERSRNDRSDRSWRSRSGWEEEDLTPSQRSSWDLPTPRVHDDRRSDWSERSRRPTPAHRYNAWAAERKASGATPVPGKEDEVAWGSGTDRENWEVEQKRLDREWYGLDEGVEEGRDPFGPMSAEYVQKREKQLETRKNKRLSAQQRQINKDNELWERNRMLTSGVVQSVDLDEDYDEENEARVHLLVHNIVPPFLDGRIVFTKQPEPVIPVK